MHIDSTSLSLLERLKQSGQLDAWDQFVDLYGPFLYQWGLRLTLRPEDAADLVQEVFLIVRTTMPEFRYDQAKTFRGYLRTIARNKWLDVVRRRQSLVGAANDEKLAAVTAPDDFEQLWEQEHRSYLVWRGLENIRPEFEPTTWQANWEFVVEGKPAKEVAAKLGVSENAVYISKLRVLRRLRSELAGLLD